MTKLTFKDPAGMHMSQQAINDLFAFVDAADDVGRCPRGRNQLLANLGDPVGKVRIHTAGVAYDETLSKLMAHFGVTVKRVDAKPAKRGKKR